MSDQFNMTGDFRGAIINIRSTLSDVQQHVNALYTEDVGVRDELAHLIAQLSSELEKVPETRQQEAEAVAQTARTLIENAQAEKPNKTLIEISGESLKQAAQNIADVLPAVVTIAAQIVAAVMRLAG